MSSYIFLLKKKNTDNNYYICDDVEALNLDRMACYDILLKIICYNNIKNVKDRIINKFNINNSQVIIYNGCSYTLISNIVEIVIKYGDKKIPDINDFATEVFKPLQHKDKAYGGDEKIFFIKNDGDISYIFYIGEDKKVYGILTCWKKQEQSPIFEALSCGVAKYNEVYNLYSEAIQKFVNENVIKINIEDFVNTDINIDKYKSTATLQNILTKNIIINDCIYGYLDKRKNDNTKEWLNYKTKFITIEYQFKKLIINIIKINNKYYEFNYVKKNTPMYITYCCDTKNYFYVNCLSQCINLDLTLSNFDNTKFTTVCLLQDNTPFTYSENNFEILSMSFFEKVKQYGLNNSLNSSNFIEMLLAH